MATTRTLRVPVATDKWTTPMYQNLVQPYQYVDYNKLVWPGATQQARQSLEALRSGLVTQNIPVADAIGRMVSGLNDRDAAAQTYLDIYSGLLGNVNQELANVGGVNASLSNEDTEAIAQATQRINDTFGADGRLAQLQNQYFQNLGNSLANQSNTARVNASNAANRAGLSANARNILANQANNQYSQSIADLNRQQAEAADSLSKSLETLLDKQYGYQTTSNDKYIKSPAESAAQTRTALYDALAKLLATNEGVNKEAALSPILQTLMNSLAQKATGTSGKSTTPYNANALVANYRDLFNSIK